ncbi:MAG: DUF1018 domain-containing protein [Methylophilaceae bacterium]|nr:DUF1018 domain-containing protein [Methylophilaceae bacterium]
MQKSRIKPARKTSPRGQYIAMVHIAANRLGFESGSAIYRDWLQKLSGAQSCKDLTDNQLSALAGTLKQQGLLQQKTTGNAPGRPTPAQWGKMETMARKLGFVSIDGEHFIHWVKRITKLDNPRFLTSRSISSVIVGLEKMWAHEQKKPANQQGRASLN